MKTEHRTFYRDVLKELNTGSLGIFAGAGLSVDAGHVNWKQLLKEITEDLELDYNNETDLIAIAQYNTNKIGNRSMINRKIIDEFNKDITETENHTILSRLPIYSYWTTNYDNLIEKSLEKAHRIADVKHSISQLAYPKPRRDAVVYKMHGDATLPNEAVITKDDYERYAVDKAPFLTTLNSELISKMFVFIGFSFSDPNLDYVLSRVRIHLKDTQRHHYHFVRKVNKEDYAEDKMAQFEYDSKKQGLFVADLKRFGLQPVYVDTYTEITEILREIEDKYKKKTVFISGSAENYNHWDSLEGQGFVHKLTASLVEKDLKIVNGFGWGIGSAVINGALSKIHESPDKYSKEQLLMKPFPQFPTGEKALPELWKEYREDIISYAGIYIAMFGNKKDNNDPSVNVPADGVYKEYEIAKGKGLFIIPIGSTGWMAEKIHQEEKAVGYGGASKEVITLLDELGTEKDADKIITIIIKLIEKINS